MGFSIGKFLGSVAPFLGTAVAGPLGGVLGAGVSAALSPSRAPVQSALVPARAVLPQQQQFQPSQFTQVSPVANPFNVQRRRVQFLPQAPRGTPGLGVAAGRLGTSLLEGMFGGGESVGDILNQARETFGRGVTKNKIINAAKFCGIESAADTFGISDTQLCKVIVSGRTRRRRGISAADIRRTRRTLRTVKSIRADLKSIRL